MINAVHSSNAKCKIHLEEIKEQKESITENTQLSLLNDKIDNLEDKTSVKELCDRILLSMLKKKASKMMQQKCFINKRQ